MGTVRQKKLAHAIVENLASDKPLNKAELLVSTGYSEVTAKASASVIIEQPGVQEELKKLGFTDEKLQSKHDQLLDSAHLETLEFDPLDGDEVVHDIVSKMQGYTLLHIINRTHDNGVCYKKFAYVRAPDNAVQDKALDKAYKIRGDYAPDKSITVNFAADEEALKQIISTLRPKTA